MTLPYSFPGDTGPLEADTAGRMIVKNQDYSTTIVYALVWVIHLSKVAVTLKV